MYNNCTSITKKGTYVEKKFHKWQRQSELFETGNLSWAKRLVPKSMPKLHSEEVKEIRQKLNAETQKYLNRNNFKIIIIFQYISSNSLLSTAITTFWEYTLYTRIVKIFFFSCFLHLLYLLCFYLVSISNDVLVILKMVLFNLFFIVFYYFTEVKR